MFHNIYDINIVVHIYLNINSEVCAQNDFMDKGA